METVRVVQNCWKQDCFPEGPSQEDWLMLVLPQEDVLRSLYYRWKTFRTDCIFGRIWELWFRLVSESSVEWWINIWPLQDASECCLRRSGERFNPECISTTVECGGGGIMIWGAFSSAGVGELIRCEQSITVKEYQKILEKGWFLSFQKLFPGEKSKEVSHF